MEIEDEWNALGTDDSRLNSVGNNSANLSEKTQQNKTKHSGSFALLPRVFFIIGRL